MSNSHGTVTPNRVRVRVRVVVVDDQKAIRAKIKAVLSTQADLEIVGMAEDGDSAIAKIKVLRPDIVLMDINMPKMNGIEVTKIVSQQFPKTKILVLSTCQKPEYIQEIIDAGADGYILKQTPAIDFVAAIHAVCKGYSYFGPSIMKKGQLANVDPEQNNSNHNYTADICHLVDRPQHLQSKTPQSNFQTFAPTTTKSSQVNLGRGKINQLMPLVYRWFNKGGIATIIALTLILSLGFILKHKTKVKASAVVNSLEEMIVVRANAAGQIADIMIEAGDKVNKGDVIAKIDSSALKTQQQQILTAISQDKQQLTRLNSQIFATNSQIIAETERSNAKIQAAQAELANSRRFYGEETTDINSQFAESTAQLTAAMTALSTAKNRLRIYQAAEAEGALSREQLVKTELEVQQQEQKIKAAQARLAKAKANLDPTLAEIEVTLAEIEVAQQRLQQSQELKQASIATLNREQEALIQQRIEAQKQLQQNLASLKQIEIELEQTNLNATAAGTISQLELRNPGQTVQSGQEIAQIFPSDGILEIKALIAPQDISKLKLNQEVEMQVSACPNSDYGTLPGRISKITRDVLQPQERTPSSSNLLESQATIPAFYDVTIAPKSLSFGRQQNICNLQPDMEASAEIIISEETILKFLLRQARLVTDV